MNSRIVLILLIFIFSCNLGFSQETGIKVHHNYNEKDFAGFVNAIETKYNVRFFYLKAWTDSIKIKQDTVPVSLEAILQQTFKNTPLAFTIDQANIIIRKKYHFVSGSIDDLFIYKQKNTIEDVKDKEEKPTPEKTVKEKNNHVLVIGKPSSQKNKVTLSGFIRENSTGEPIIGAVVYAEDINKGTSSGLNGYYVITLPAGQHIFTIQSLGYKKENKRILLHNDGSLNFQLKEKITELKGVVIESDKYKNVSGLQIGMQKLDMKTLKQIPTALGEADILKTALLLPGVKNVGEASSGFNVRGGSADQNLLMLNNAPVFNSSHFFGFFSTFNQDLIRHFELYKSGVPARYGGRISSIMDIKMKSGNKKKFTGKGGISPYTGRLTLEGPIKKEKASFIIGARSTYSDWILKELKDPDLNNSSASFYDIGGKLDYDINKHNTAYLSGYYSHDFFRFKFDTTYNYDNFNLTGNWKHVFNNKLFAEISGIYSTYAYNISGTKDTMNAFDLDYRIDHKQMQANFSYFPNNKHKIRFGLDDIIYNLQPGHMKPSDAGSLIESIKLEPERANIASIYLSDKYEITPRLLFYGGIRYSLFSRFGPETVYKYTSGKPLETTGIRDTVNYGKGKIVKNYHGPELRATMRYKLNERNSIKLSYNRMRQYLHMLSNTTSISPTDIWKLSDKYIAPQIGDQYAIGYYLELPKNIEPSVEIYYKKIINIIEYKSGAELILNENIETDIMNALGRAYGIEFIIKKKYGRLNGWVSYTYSKTEIKADSKHPEERINNGEYFPARYDKPHDITVVVNYKFSRRFSLSSNYTYSTGRPITYPAGLFDLSNTTNLFYTDRNEYRIPYYARWDMSINLDGNLKADKPLHSSWSFSIYNILGRKNIYSIFFKTNNGEVNGYKMSIFAQPIATITYNFRF